MTAWRNTDFVLRFVFDKTKTKHFKSIQIYLIGIMKYIFLRIVLIIIITGCFLQNIKAQYSSIKVKSKYEHYTDSLKHFEYNYTFPILGQGAYSKGFDIPYPAGAMANWIWMKQGLVIDNLQLGFSGENVDIPLTDVDFIQFGNNVNISQSVNVRPDLWVFPFLNVYGLFGYGAAQTEVNLIAPIALTSKVTQNITTKGVGIMGAGGVGPVWISVDANWTWNKPELLDKAVKVNVLGMRFGHTFVSPKKPERNFALWAGTMRASMSSETSGQIALKDALPPELWDRKDQLVGNYWDWYNSLNPSNPLDRPKIKIADETLTPIINAIDSKNGEGIVKYAMNKQVKGKWNGIVGAQFQANKHWMFRTEGGVIGDRKSFLISVNYRFLM